MYKDWLNRAWRGGLRLMIMSAVNNEIIGKYHNNALQQTRLNLRDGPSIDRQIEAAYRFQDEIDTDYGCGNADNVRRTGPGGCGWYRIVTNPADARAVINAGKLAVVLGVEVDTLFDCGLKPAPHGQTVPGLSTVASAPNIPVRLMAARLLVRAPTTFANPTAHRAQTRTGTGTIPWSPLSTLSWSRV